MGASGAPRSLGRPARVSRILHSRPAGRRGRECALIDCGPSLLFVRLPRLGRDSGAWEARAEIVTGQSVPLWRPPARPPAQLSSALGSLDGPAKWPPRPERAGELNSRKRRARHKSAFYSASLGRGAPSGEPSARRVGAPPEVRRGPKSVSLKLGRGESLSEGDRARARKTAPASWRAGERGIERFVQSEKPSSGASCEQLRRRRRSINTIRACCWPRAASSSLAALFCAARAPTKRKTVVSAAAAAAVVVAHVAGGRASKWTRARLRDKQSSAPLTFNPKALAKRRGCSLFPPKSLLPLSLSLSLACSGLFCVQLAHEREKNKHSTRGAPAPSVRHSARATPYLGPQISTGRNADYHAGRQPGSNQTGPASGRASERHCQLAVPLGPTQIGAAPEVARSTNGAGAGLLRVGVAPPARPPARIRLIGPRRLRLKLAGRGLGQPKLQIENRFASRVRRAPIKHSSQVVGSAAFALRTARGLQKLMRRPNWLWARSLSLSLPFARSLARSLEPTAA